MDKKGNSNTGEKMVLLELFRETFPESMPTGSSLAMNGWRICVKQGFLTHPLTHIWTGKYWLSASIRRWVFITLGGTSIYAAWRDQYLRRLAGRAQHKYPFSETAIKDVCKGMIPYCIRCKENAQIAGKGGSRQALQSHFRALKTGEGKTLGPVMMYGQQYYLEATRLTNGQLLVICRTGKGIEAYGKRWRIEALFGCLKSKGFNLEDTPMTAPTKIERLMSVLVI